ncbi:hypothetical protein R3P38DRAFT_92560 [Favolaschia claudopus]|uniref:Uncharacterized protein n=1 Tax=Favolaschia claudopus TaxID=2862362 RepID=A0AAW0DA29_9AGAR
MAHSGHSQQPEAVCIDFLKNKNTSAALGPFDGRVAALCAFEDTDYLLTTHADYVPAPPTSRQHDLFLRADLRYGPDDFTRWPQQYSPEYCHLPCVRTKSGSPPELSILWDNPSPMDFVKRSDEYTLTPNLGRLDDDFRTALEQVVEKLRMEHALYVAATPASKIPPPLATLVVSMDAALERIQTIPLNYDQMVLSVTRLQLTWLELDAMLQYMTVFKPQMDAPFGPRPELAACVGAFTFDAQVAQFLHKAGLPYWYLRPAKQFSREIILELVQLVQPSAFVCIDPHPRETAVSRANNNTAHKIALIHKHSMTKPWYEDPFDMVASEPVASSSSVNTPTHTPHRGGLNRYKPYTASNPSRSRGATNQGPKPPAGRDKYIALDRLEMPPTIPSWQNALKQVDRGHYPLSQRSSRDTYYVFPEPALFASPEDPAQRQQRLFHFELLKDALIYRLCHASAAEDAPLLSSQQWRDVLGGRVAARSSRATRTQLRIEDTERVLQPALAACGLDAHRHLPVDPRDIPAITIPRAREIIWSVAEMNFRFELLSLDRRASGLSRGGACRARCFPSPQLLDIPLDDSKRGFASSVMQDRHPYTLRLARLMLDWKGVPRVICELAQQSECSTDDMVRLEEAVPRFYCQQFYEHFGRAAVVPLRIEHEIGS